MTSDVKKPAELLRLTSNPFPKLGAIASPTPEQGLGIDVRLYEQARVLIEKIAISTSLEEVKEISDDAAVLEKLARLAKATALNRATPIGRHPLETA